MKSERINIAGWIVSSLLAGFMAGFIFTTILSIEHDKNRAAFGYIKLGGEFYSLSPLSPLPNERD